MKRYLSIDRRCFISSLALMLIPSEGRVHLNSVINQHGLSEIPLQSLDYTFTKSEIHELNARITKISTSRKPALYNGWLLTEEQLEKIELLNTFLGREILI